MGAVTALEVPAPHRRFRIEVEEDVGELRRAVRAQAARIPALREGEAELVATELATNILRHTPGGYVLARPAGDGIELIAVDRGPGLPSSVQGHLPREATAPGTGLSRTPGGLGVGLAAVRRRSWLFDCYSDRGGAVILARVGPAAGPPTGPWQWGGIDVPLGGEGPSGDAWAVAATLRGLVAVLADGLGHGPDAAAAAHEAITVLEQRPDHFASAGHAEATVAEFAEQAHQGMRGTRGGVLGACHLDPGTGKAVFVGVGNVAGRIHSGGKSAHLVSHPGTLGVSVVPPRIRPEKYAWSVGATLVLTTDGIDTRWDLATRPDLARHHPAIVAAVLHRDHARGRDDAAVLVVRDTRAPGRALEEQ